MFSVFRRNLVDLPTGVSLSYLWCSGFMLGFFMVVQIFSGLILSFLYVADSGLSFFCVLDFTGESLYSWLVRYCHMWGVTFIFVLIYIHMGRGLYYSSYTKIGVWNVGFLLYVLMMVEAFLGYMLPWHQMSYWAATVLTSMLKSVPIIGGFLYEFIVGGFSVTKVTLVRVFSLHVSLAFFMLGVSVLHMFYLHMGGSKKPLFVFSGYGDSVSFHSYYTFKDGYVLLCFFSFLVFCMLFFPDSVLDVESYMEADPLVTPSSIKPEWYFLAFFAMLRSVESKLGGLVLVLVFLFLLWVPSFKDSCVYSVFRQVVFWMGVSVFFLLSFLGSCHPEYPFVLVGKVFSFLLLFLVFVFKIFPANSYLLFDYFVFRPNS